MQQDIIFNALQQGLLPGLIVLGYLFSCKILDMKKDDKYIEVSSNLINTLTKLDKFITNVTETIVNGDKDKKRIAITDSFNKGAKVLIENTIRIIVLNNVVANEANIKTNLNNIITCEYYAIYETLSKYYCFNRSEMVSNSMKISWVDKIQSTIETIIFSSNLSKDDKILHAITQIDTIMTSYATYCQNNSN